MIKKVKWILIGIAVITIIGAFVTVDIQAKRIKRQNEKIARMAENMNQVLDDNVTQTTLVLAKNEVIGQIKRERDSLAKALKIKPKQIERIVTIEISIHDTVKVPVPTYITGKSEWTIRDSSGCLKIAYNAKLRGDSLIVKRTNLKNDNEISQVFYKTATHIWFIRTGKWKYVQDISSKCGVPKTQSITFLKK